MTNPNLPAPLNAAERAIVVKLYNRYGILNGSTQEKLRCLKMDIGDGSFSCGPGATPEMNLLAYERIYLLTRNRGG